jgi:hypothetical protein
MGEDVDGRVPQGGQVALRLILADPQLRMEGTEHDVQGRERLRLHVGRSVREDIHLDRAEDAERVARRAQLCVQLVDPDALPREPLLVHAVRDLEALRVIGDRHEGTTESASLRDHLREREPAVAVRRMHLEVRVRGSFPVRFGVEHPTDLGEGEEPTAGLVWFGDPGRCVDPGVDPRGDPGADRAELGERAARDREVAGLLAPEAGGARGLVKSAAAMSGLLIAGPPQELREVAVGQAHAAGASSRCRS